MKIDRIQIFGLLIVCGAILTGSMSTAIRAEAEMNRQLPAEQNRQLPAEQNRQLPAEQNAFALDLYAQFQHDHENLFFSPSGISTALAMAYAGARGPTKQQMSDTLHFTLDDAALHAAFAGQAQHLADIQRQGDVALYVANALWVQQNFALQQAFREQMRQYYQANLFQVNFAGAYEAVRAKINAWVEKQTQRRITNLLPAGTVSALTRLVLTNAIYFKGNWAHQFEQDATVEAPFRTSPGASVPVDMMQQQTMFKYGEFPGGQVLILPYAGEELSMVVLLPQERGGLGALHLKLSVDAVTGWMAQAGLREVNVLLPKFRITSQLSVSAALKTLGMTEAFSENADFSGMAADAQLHISDVVHKAFVDVNEAGTEAAAATAVAIGVTSVMEPQPIPEFRADHPFMFLILDKQSGAWLFVGRVMNPVSR